MGRAKIRPQALAPHFNLQQRYYQVDLAGIGTLTDVLEGMWSDQVDRLAFLAVQAEQLDPEPAS